MKHTLALLALVLVGRAAFSQTITITAGTYGGNVGAPHGNVTAHLAATCNGTTACLYTILAGIIGDPVPYQKKNYVAEWTCSGDPTVKSLTAPAEAGLGSTLTLSCAPIFSDSNCVSGQTCFKIDLICVPAGSCSTTTRYVRQFRMDVGTATVP